MAKAATNSSGANDSIRLPDAAARSSGTIRVSMGFADREPTQKGMQTATIAAAMARTASIRAFRLPRRQERRSDPRPSGSILSLRSQAIKFVHCKIPSTSRRLSYRITRLQKPSEAIRFDGDPPLATSPREDSVSHDDLPRWATDLADDAPTGSMPTISATPPPPIQHLAYGGLSTSTAISCSGVHGFNKNRSTPKAANFSLRSILLCPTSVTSGRWLRMRATSDATSAPRMW